MLDVSAQGPDAFYIQMGLARDIVDGVPCRRACGRRYRAGLGVHQIV